MVLWETRLYLLLAVSGMECSDRPFPSKKRWKRRIRVNKIITNGHTAEISTRLDTHLLLYHESIAEGAIIGI